MTRHTRRRPGGEAAERAMVDECLLGCAMTVFERLWRGGQRFAALRARAELEAAYAETPERMVQWHGRIERARRGLARRWRWVRFLMPYRTGTRAKTARRFG